MTEASLWDRPNARWNVTWLVLDGLVFALGYNFLSPISILPVFVARLTPIATLAGSFVAIDQLGIALPQFFATRWATRAARQGRRKWLKAWVNLAGRLPLAASIVVLLYFGDSEPGVVVAVVMVAFGLFRLFEGMGVPAYYDLIGTVVHPNHRARYFAWHQAGTAIGGLASGFGARWVLGRLPFPWNFGTSFTIGLVLAIVVTIVFLQVREPRPTMDLGEPVDPEDDQAWWRSIRTIWQVDVGFRRLITTRALIGIAGMAPAYYAVSAVRGLAATDTDAATFGIFTLSAQLIGTLVWGELTARLHRHWFLVGGPLIGAAGACGALFASSIGSLYPVFIASGMATAAQLMCDMSLPLHLAEGSKVPRGTYIAAYSTLIIPFSITAPIIGGILAGATGYPTINLLGIVTYIIATACGFRFLHRPRHGLTDAP